MAKEADDDVGAGYVALDVCRVQHVTRQDRQPLRSLRNALGPPGQRPNGVAGGERLRQKCLPRLAGAAEKRDGFHVREVGCFAEVKITRNVGTDKLRGTYLLVSGVAEEGEAGVSLVEYWNIGILECWNVGMMQDARMQYGVGRRDARYTRRRLLAPYPPAASAFCIPASPPLRGYCIPASCPL